MVPFDPFGRGGYERDSIALVKYVAHKLPHPVKTESQRRPDQPLLPFTLRPSPPRLVLLPGVVNAARDGSNQHGPMRPQNGGRSPLASPDFPSLPSFFFIRAQILKGLEVGS